MDSSEVGKAGMSYGTMHSGQVVLKRDGGFLTREGEILVGGAIILIAAFVYPYVQGTVNLITPGCVFHRLTGLPCLLCGMTRSLAATSHGHLGEAFHLHLLGPPLFALLVLAVLVLSMELALGRPILPRLDKRGRMLLAWGALGLLVAAWIARLAFFGINV